MQLIQNILPGAASSKEGALEITSMEQQQAQTIAKESEDSVEWNT